MTEDKMIVMSMEDGKIIREPVPIEAEPCDSPLDAIPQAYPYLQPRLQEISFPPKAACPPPPLGDIDVPLSAFDV
jgi:hypothetical protein